jgi:tetratricopeptide (TPR) repeat protein
MRQLIERYPGSIWADNAAFEIARSFLRAPARDVWAVSVYSAGSPAQDATIVQEDLETSKRALANFAERYPTSPFAPLALSMRAQSALSLLDFQTAIETYEMMVQKYPDSVETSDAGTSLSRLYTARGRWHDALVAADTGAAVTPWEIKGEALLVAARAAGRAGDPDGARRRYEEAHAAAKEARASANEHRLSSRGLSGGQIVLRSDAVMRECEEALRGGPRKVTPAAPPPGTTVTGRLERDGSGLAGVRIALAVAADEGRISPFVETPTAYGVSGADGRFTLAAVLPGAYALAAYAYSQPRNSQPWQVAEPALPIRVENAPVALPANELMKRPALRPEREAASGQTRGGESRSQSTPRGGRGGAGGRAGRGRGGDGAGMGRGGSGRAAGGPGTRRGGSSR